MADWQSVEFPERTAARRAIRHAVAEAFPALRILAEGFLAASSEIDLLAVGADGELISVRWPRPGRDREALTLCLSDLGWLEPRAQGLAKLAPGRGIEVSARPRAILVADDFSLDTQSAASAFEDWPLSLMRCRFVRQTGRLTALLTPLAPLAPTSGKTAGPADGPAAPPPAQPTSAPPASDRTGGLGTLQGGFRTGLSEADLERGTSPDPTSKPNAPSTVSPNENPPQH